MSRSIADLEPVTRERAERFLALLDAAGIHYAVLETLRTQAVQTAYYAQGRKPLEEINRLRAEAGLPAIGAQEGRRIITRTMNSRHLLGEALDLAPLDARGRPWWAAPAELWTKIGEMGEAVGLEWGGRWDATPGKLGWDCPHFQRIHG